MTIDHEIADDLSNDSRTTFDVVCGMELAIDKAKFHTTYGGVLYHFCSNNCKQHFNNAPERYVWEK